MCRRYSEVRQADCRAVSPACRFEKKRYFKISVAILAGWPRSKGSPRPHVHDKNGIRAITITVLCAHYRRRRGARYLRGVGAQAERWRRVRIQTAEVTSRPCWVSCPRNASRDNWRFSAAEFTCGVSITIASLSLHIADNWSLLPSRMCSVVASAYSRQSLRHSSQPATQVIAVLVAAMFEQAQGRGSKPYRVNTGRQRTWVTMSQNCRL
jgi:hypothetical protein